MTKTVAWLGGAAFVGSLVLVGWWFLWPLGRYADGNGPGALAFDTALFTVFAAHHSVFARESVKRRLVFIPPVLVRSFYVWVASLLLVAVPLFWMPIGGDAYHVRGGAGLLCAGVQLAGFWLTWRAAARLDPLELAGIRQVINKPRTPVLQVTGPFRMVRHPLYLGWALMFLGAAHMTLDRLAFAVLSTAYLIVAVPWEERSLRQSFGDEYDHYTRRVRWRIVPFLY